MKCTAHKTNGTPCNAPAMKGTTVCRVHGGAAVAKVRERSLKHGGYARTVPSFLKETYEAYCADPDLMKLDKDIALARALFDRYLSNWESNQTVSADGVNHLTELLDRLSKLVERRTNIEHKSTYVVTHDKLIIWMTQLASMIQNGIQQYIPDAKQRDALNAHIRAGVAELGVPGVSE